MTRSRIVIFLTLTSLILGAGGRELSAQPEVIDGVAAVVNKEVITYSEVRSVSGPSERLLLTQYRGAELEAKIKQARASALKDLIDRELILQAFKKESMSVPDHFVNEQIKQIIQENFGGDRNTFIKTLQAQNFSLGQFKKLEMEKIMVQAMRGRNVKLNTVIPPNRLDAYYRAHRPDFTSKEQVKLRMIMIPAKTSDQAGQKAMAEEIRGKLAHGAEFDRMAQIYSEDSTRDLGGDWGWIDRGTLTAPLEKVAFSLPSGKISNIVDVAGNYYILKVEERRGGATKPFPEVRAEIDKRLSQEEAQAQQERWLAGLRQKAYIKTF
ncbi:MAG: peptidylprolyl isomerase [Verrucomicrobiota bacterium]